MTDLITPSWLLCELLTPKEHERCDSYQNLFIVHPLPIMTKYKNSMKDTNIKTTELFGCYAPRPDLKTRSKSVKNEREQGVWERDRERNWGKQSSVCIRSSFQSQATVIISYVNGLTTLMIERMFGCECFPMR